MDRPSFEQIMKYFKLIEEDLDNFEKYSNIYPFDDISMLEKKMYMNDDSSKYLSEFSTSVDSIESKDNLTLDESMSSEA